MTERTGSGGEDRTIEELLGVGSEVAGGVAGGTIGYVVGGPAGAAVGGASGPLLSRALRHVAHEVTHRLLGPREEVRVGAILEYAARKIRENTEAGQRVREDGFFDEQPGERASAEEVFECVLLSAQRDPQEKKLRFYGNLLANLAFSPRIDREQATLLVRLARDLSYRQLCILALAHERATSGPPLGAWAWAGDEGPSEMSERALDTEMHSLYLQSLVEFREGETSEGATTDPASVAVRLQGLGSVLYRLMELQHADPTDLSRVAVLLDRQTTDR